VSFGTSFRFPKSAIGNRQSTIRGSPANIKVEKRRECGSFRKMLDDRSYMRQSGYRASWSAVTWLLGSLVVLFLVQQAVIHNGAGEAALSDWLYLSRDGIRHGRVWEFLTFQFFHTGWWHLGFNCLFIYFVGRQIEEDFGAAGFWKLYLISGVAGGVLQYGLAEAFPFSPLGKSVTLGASAGASGLFAAFAMLHPDLPMYIFPLPISIRAKYLLWADLALAAYGISAPRQEQSVANGAHLGGILYAMGYVWWVVRGNPPPWRALFARAAVRPPALLRSPAGSSMWRPEPKAAAPRAPREYMSEEVDPILDKISAHGIHSLTEKERKTLEAARNRMAKGSRP
jgi:membrane associated rhomboid family serine protease